MPHVVIKRQHNNTIPMNVISFFIFPPPFCDQYSIKSRRLQEFAGNWGGILMMHRLRRYDVFRYAQNDVVPLRVTMMRCLPLCARRHTSLGEAVIIGGANIICRRQTSFKKRVKRCLNRGKNEQKVSNNGNKNYFFLFFICLTMTTPNKITDIKRRGPVQT